MILYYIIESVSGHLKGFISNELTLKFLITRNYVSVCLSDCLSLYLSIYLSMAIQPFVQPWPLFQFLNLLRSR
jgi:hypothetical protein